MSKGVTGPFLVCAPLSTLPNWMSELKRFTPKVSCLHSLYNSLIVTLFRYIFILILQIPTVLFHGNQEKRDALLLEIKQKFKIDGVHGVKFFPVVVTSFEVVIRGISVLFSAFFPIWRIFFFVDRKVLERLQWRYIIVDEGNESLRLVMKHHI